MNIFAIFTLVLSACDGVRSVTISAPSEVSVAAGQTVTVLCRYALRYAGRTKYWCRGGVPEQCTVVVSTKGPREEGRTSISDDRNALEFRVTLTALQPQDQDQYWCGVTRPFRDVYTPVLLHVLQPTVNSRNTTTATLRPEDCRAPGSGVWASLRWVLFCVMLACPLGVCVWERRSAVRNCGPLGSRVCPPTCPSLLPCLPQTG